jgi:molecular chaperone DnaK
MKRIVGIDLGTTYSSIAQLNDLGKPDIFPVDAERVVPSAVYFESNNKFYVGGVAINALTSANEKVVRWIKKTMGSDYYDISNDGKEVAGGRLIIGKKWTPAELSSFVLKHLASNFEKIHGKIAGAVVTVPAYFDEKRRKATMDAAEMAGLNVLGIVNEPTAAAIYYSSEKKIDGTNLVFDLGGGTFDITIMDVNGQNVEVISSEGDSNLGGFDFDLAVTNYFLSQYEAQGNSISEINDEEFAQWLLKAETTKINLSKLSSAKFSASVGSKMFSEEINRAKFNEITAPLVSRIEMLIELALDEANLEAKQIDNVLLCGGSTRIPIIREKLNKIFGKEPLEVGNVDEAVSLGAAIYAGVLALDQIPDVLPTKAKDYLLEKVVSDVCNHSYGTIAVTEDEFTGNNELKNLIIIKKNSRIPVEVTERLYTISDNQTQLHAKITQGESTDPTSVNIVSEGYLKFPARPAGQPIDIVYSYDKNQRMKCTFTDVNSGKEITLELELKTNQNSKSEDIFADFDL